MGQDAAVLFADPAGGGNPLLGQGSRLAWRCGDQRLQLAIQEAAGDHGSSCGGGTLQEIPSCDLHGCTGTACRAPPHLYTVANITNPITTTPEPSTSRTRSR
jgi:hypothetical protein